MGLRYSVMTSSYSQLILYFLIQTIASFLILAFYLYDFSILLTSAFILKFSIFPFFMWYINVIYRLPNFIFWLASTFHKVPPMLMIKIFGLSLNYRLLWVSIVFTSLFIGIIILSVYDFRMLLVLSSIGNNSWLLLSQITNFTLFMLYIIVYRLRLFMVILSFSSLSKLQLPKSFSLNSISLSFWVLTLSGIPPFPLFYCKVLVIIAVFFTLSVNNIFILFLLSRAFIFISYLRSLMKYYVYSYSSLLFYLVKY